MIASMQLGIAGKITVVAAVRDGAKPVPHWFGTRLRRRVSWQRLAKRLG